MTRSVAVVVALGILVLGIFAVASGGFTAVYADRGSTIQATDENAYLGVETQVNETDCELDLTVTNQFNTDQSLSVDVYLNGEYRMIFVDGEWQSSVTVPVGEQRTVSLALDPNETATDYEVRGTATELDVSQTGTVEYDCNNSEEQ